MLKYVGIILVSGAISMIGAYLSYRTRRNKKIRKSLFELLLYIKSSIDNGGIPLDTIFSCYKSDELERCGFSECLKSGSVDAFKMALSGESVILPPQLSELYMSFADSVGKSGFRETESELCKRYIYLIEAEEKKISEKEEVKQELYRRLGLLCGLLAALLLI